MKTTSREVQRVRHELKMRDVTVTEIRQLGNNMLGITFQGPSLADFVSLSFDDHVKFIFKDDTGEVVRRDYTPVHYDKQRCTLTLEFALHAHGAATDWARRAQVGTTAIIGGPKGSMIVPTNYDWHLLVGDLSSLPAITRRLQELPASTKAIAVVQINDVSDIRDIPSTANVDLQWVTTSEDVFAYIRDLDLPAGDGYTWAAGEGNTMKQLRSLLINEKHLPSSQLRIAAYWKQGTSDFHERLE